MSGTKDTRQGVKKAHPFPKVLNFTPNVTGLFLILQFSRQKKRQLQDILSCTFSISISFLKHSVMPKKSPIHHCPSTPHPRLGTLCSQTGSKVSFKKESGPVSPLKCKQKHSTVLAVFSVLIYSQQLKHTQFGVLA